MSISGVPELTIPQLLDQPWTKRLARIASVVAMMGMGGVATYFLTLGHRIDAIESDRATRIVQTQDQFKAINNTMADLSISIGAQTDKLDAMAAQLNNMNGVLQQMQRERTAANFTSPNQPGALR